MTKGVIPKGARLMKDASAPGQVRKIRACGQAQRNACRAGNAQSVSPMWAMQATRTRLGS